MRKFVGCLVLLSAIFLNGCGYSRIEPGHAGIKVHLYGGKKGIDFEPVPTGAIFFNPMTTSIYEYPTYVQTAVWSREDTRDSPGNEEVSFNSSEGMVITGDISLSYSLVPDKVPSFFGKFRTDNLFTFTHGFLRNIARDSFNEEASRYKVEEIYGLRKEEFLSAVKERVNSQVRDYGVVIDQFGFIGAPRLPEAVVSALNAKIQATQNAIRVENELREATAQAQKRIAQAEGEAQANKVLTQSLSPTLLEWKTLEITEAAVAKWNGARPMVEGNSSGLLLNITPNR